MKLTVDANVLFAALIRNGLSRRLIFHPGLDLDTPYFFLEELKKYREELVSKSRMSEVEFLQTFHSVLCQVEPIDSAVIKPYMRAASTLIEDSKDWPYLACALFSGSDLLTQDPGFRSQARVKVHSVEELARELGLI
ncbi:hypothetical protein HY994_01285 [Candidatus Micrarchaeota archaeon]|nr:hypothetical protein [Candidatus Micrarchaeota archaeon]